MPGFDLEFGRVVTSYHIKKKQWQTCLASIDSVLPGGDTRCLQGYAQEGCHCCCISGVKNETAYHHCEADYSHADPVA